MSKTLLYPYGLAQISGVIKTEASDFRVDENLGFEPEGEGEHLFLQIEKSGRTTQELVEQLASDFHIKARDVGYSGLKDKIAITTQWFSLHLPGQMSQLQLPEATAYKRLAQGWHNRKLRPGTHRSNDFEIIVRQVGSFSESSQRQVELIQQKGMANYFGTQRFGDRNDNVSRALQIFSNERKTRKLSRNKKSVYISALRSELFNQILSKRIESGHWVQPLEGDVFMLSGSRSIFQESISEGIQNRFDRFDLSSTSSLFGSGETKLKASALDIENAVFADNANIVESLLKVGAKLQMRPVRIRVENLKVEYQQDIQCLKINARLPRGSYFTSLLNHFIDING